ncbi:MAG: lineage-specific thermal regulator protein [Firmicutes bacterium]|nr:lineage-specific thermal regulator protein [Bacillota bacterium]
MAKKVEDYESYMRLTLGLYILKILKHGPAHGNRMVTEINRRTEGAYTPNTNALYPLLRRLEEKSYIVGEWASSETRSKRIYTITEAGITRVPELEVLLEDRLKKLERKIKILRTDLLGN